MDRTFASHEVARLLGVNIKTIQRWDRAGRLKPAGRTDTGRRYYTEDQSLAFRHQQIEPHVIGKSWRIAG